jgi:hypothetical protein
VPLPPAVSISGDIRGPEALRFLPEPDGAGERTCVYCDHVTAVDTWSGCMLKALLDYARRELAIPVQFSPPADPTVGARLAALDGMDCPAPRS